MSTLLERRYRRVVGLLPAGYRHRWGEDMVSAFMESAQPSQSGGTTMPSRPPLSERLSVIALAIRLRLNGSHATSRGLVWYHTVHGFALIALLYQSIAATLSVAEAVQMVTQYEARGAESWWAMLSHYFIWSYSFSLIWVAAFSCLVLGRVVAARVLAVLALVTTIGVTQATFHIVAQSGAGAPPPFELLDLSRWGWLAGCVAAVFVTPPDARASRRLWFGAYAVGSAVLVTSIVLMTSRSLVNLAVATSVALIVAMMLALFAEVAGRRASPRWLLSLAVFAGGFSGVRLLLSLIRDVPSYAPGPTEGVQTSIDLISVSLALICAVVGLLALRRFTGRTPASDVLATKPG